MQVNHEFDIHIHRIKSYGEGEVTITLPFEVGVIETATGDESPKSVQTERLSHSAIILPNLLIRDWSPKTVAELSQADIQQLAALTPELVIIGTGKRLQWPDRAVMTPLMEAGIGYEIMDTAAACRTYNILSYEGRAVAVALMMI
ncbi:MAG: Mth938-like domain-containing protein [Pseudomonadota bacterium]|nr:Mth938-like domain-containing protein [Pseudomonadota bacterium]